MSTLKEKHEYNRAVWRCANDPHIEIEHKLSMFVNFAIDLATELQNAEFVDKLARIWDKLNPDVTQS